MLNVVINLVITNLQMASFNFCYFPDHRFLLIVSNLIHIKIESGDFGVLIVSSKFYVIFTEFYNFFAILLLYYLEC